MTKQKRGESILDLSNYLNKRVHIKFQGGREVIGTLKGYDNLQNLVLDQTEEYERDPAEEYKILDSTRDLGLVVCRGNPIVAISPMDGEEEIDNPFIQ